MISSGLLRKRIHIISRSEMPERWRFDASDDLIIPIDEGKAAIKEATTMIMEKIGDRLKELKQKIEMVKLENIEEWLWPKAEVDLETLELKKTD